MKLFLAFLALFFASHVRASELDLAAAQKIAQAAEEYGIKKGWKLSVAIVNAENNLVVFYRGDGSYPGSIDAAIGKAKSANSFQRSTTAFVQGVKDGRMGLLSVPGIVAIEGGIPLVSAKGVHVGAIGVSGAKSTEDEEAAIAAAKLLK